jgi:2'-5' RNA ligase
MNGMRRIFVALKIPAKLRSEISRATLKYREGFPQVSWVKPESFHVTVVFLGSIDEPRLGRTRLLVRKVAENFRPFILALGRPRIFGGRVILFEMKSEEFSKLQDTFRALPGKFSKPHLTLARISGQIRTREGLLKGLAFFSGKSIPVESVEVMESKYGKKGRIYTTVYEAKFKGRHVSRPR